MKTARDCLCALSAANIICPLPLNLFTPCPLQVYFDAQAATNNTVVDAWSHYKAADVTKTGHKTIESAGAHFYFTSAAPNGQLACNSWPARRFPTIAPLPSGAQPRGRRPFPLLFSSKARRAGASAGTTFPPTCPPPSATWSWAVK